MPTTDTPAQTDPAAIARSLTIARARVLRAAGGREVSLYRTHTSSTRLYTWRQTGDACGACVDRQAEWLIGARLAEREPCDRMASPGDLLVPTDLGREVLAVLSGAAR